MDNAIDLLVASAPLAAVLLAALTLVIQYRLFHKERKPIVMPIPLEFNDFKLPQINKDWVTKEDIGRKFSNSSLIITNYGGTTAMVKSYNYHFNNFEEIEKALGKFDGHSKYVSIQKNIDNPNSFNLKLCNGEKSYELRNIESVLRRGNILRVAEEQEILLPSYFIIISNFLLQQTKKKVLPELTLKLRYIDIDNKETLKIFIIKWDESRAITNRGGWEITNGAIIAKFVKEYKGKNVFKLKNSKAS